MAGNTQERSWRDLFAQTGQVLRQGIDRADEAFAFFACWTKRYLIAVSHAFFPDGVQMRPGTLTALLCGIFVVIALCREPALNRGVEKMLHPDWERAAQAMVRADDVVWGSTILPFQLDVLMAKYEEKKAQEELSGPTTIPIPQEQQLSLTLKSLGGTSVQSGYTKPVLSVADIDWSQLQGSDSSKAMYYHNSINSDTIGWLRIPQTNIDYPVVQGATVNEYLSKDIFGDYSNDGVLWVDTYVHDSSSNTVVFGHNWTNVSGNPKIGRSSDVMFAQLPSFVNSSFASQVPYIYYATTSADQVWQVFAVFYTTDLDFYLYNNNTYGRQQSIIDKAKRLSLYNYGVSVSGDDRILTLSTCTRALGSSANQRMVVMAKLVG